MFDAAPSLLSLPLAQSAEFARALSTMGLSTEQLQIGAGRGQALLQSRMVPFVGQIGLISRGPLWHGAPCAAMLRARLADIGYPVFLNAENGQERLLRAAGLVQVMTPATLAVLDVCGGPDALRARMHGKWRNRLRRAERAGLSSRVIVLPDARSDWVVAAEEMQRTTRGYRGLPPALAVAYGQANPGGAILFEALQDDVAVAGMVFLRHGTQATYFLGTTTQAGRAVHAHTFLLARAATYLAEAGCSRLDLGTLDTEATSGLARFKLGSGARVERLGGTWFYARPLAAVIRPKRPWRRREWP